MCGILACLNYNVKRERSYILQVLFMAFPPQSRLSPGRQHRVPRQIQDDATDLNLEESFLTHARIAHTGWVTHGEPAPRNSHPQSSGAENEFLVVHNGVITNHEENAVCFPGRHLYSVHSVLEMEVEQIIKGNYEHFMQKEIHEQLEFLTTTARGRLIRGGTCKAKTVLLGGLKDHLKTIRRSRRIVFIGCGTSYNSALAARPILEEISGIPVTMEIASDLLIRQGPIYREDTAVFVSQSGETADTLHALEYALQNGALCVGITNTVGSAIARNTHCGVHIKADAEAWRAPTQIVVMAMLALAIGGDAISNQARRDALVDCLSDLPNKVREVLELDREMEDLAKLLIAKQSLPIEGMLAGEMKHRPLALVDDSLPVVAITIYDACFRGDAAAVSCGGVCRVIEVPQVEDCLQPVVNIVCLQPYHYAVLTIFPF
ncbi:hypothetical protein ACJRO7_030646 [Eucalyptus globulus]|uniref:SIS domain-containing protein n=1 Tax=Eucalyptus globulus TaxID=34317 RepID=A0ABD3JIG4_EUCGL